MIPLRQLEEAVSAYAEGAGALSARSALSAEAFASTGARLGDVGSVLPKIGLRVGDDVKTLNPTQFFDKFDVTYAPEPLYFTPHIGLGNKPEIARLPFESLRSAFEDKFASKLGHGPQNHFPNPLLKWLYGDEIQAGSRADVAVGRSKAGYGLFANSPLRPGQFVGEYTGVAEENSSSHWNNAYTFNLRNGGVMNAQNYGNETRFINHSDVNANVQPVHVDLGGHERIAFIAKKPINPGQELLFNYGKDYWTNLKPIELG